MEEFTFKRDVENLMVEYPSIDSSYNFRDLIASVSYIPDDYPYAPAVLEGSIFPERQPSGFKKLMNLEEGDIIVGDREIMRLNITSEDDPRITSGEDLYFSGMAGGMTCTKNCLLRIERIENERFVFQSIGFKRTDDVFVLKKDKSFEEFRDIGHSVRIVHKESIVVDELKFGMEFKNLFNQKRGSIKDACQKVASIAEQIYPDRVDLVYADELDENSALHDVLDQYSQQGLIIKFPEVDVTNRSSIVHQIHDMYVFLPIKFNGGTGSPRGFRGKLEAKEIKTNYNHSHLGGGIYAWNSFCLGRGSFSDNINVLSAGYNEELWEVVLTQLEFYLGWESLSGGPYKKIKRAISGNTTQRNTLYNSGAKTLCKVIGDILPDDAMTNAISIKIQDNGNQSTNIQVRGFKKIANFLKEYANEDEKIDPNLLSQSYIYVSVDNRQIGSLSISEAKKVVDNAKISSGYATKIMQRSFKFKGEEVRQELYVDESLYKESYDTEILDLNPRLKKYLESFIISNFMEKMSSEVYKSEQKNEKYNEYKQQIETFPEEILACSSVF